MSVAASLVKVRDRLPSAYPVLRIVVPAGLGYMLGVVIMNPHHRMIEILVGFFIAAAAILLKPARAIAVFIVIFLFPAGLSIGTSNNVFILILVSTWIAQQTLAGEKITLKTPLDLPIITLSAAYLLSLVNVPHGLYGINARGLGVYFTAVAIYYMVVSLTPDVAAIRRLLFAGAIGAALMAAQAFLEIFLPHKQLLPYFFISSQVHLEKGVVRAGSGFRIVSLFAQYCIFYLMLGIFLFTHEKRRGTRFAIALLLLGILVSFVSTAMRGAMMAGAVGLLFLLWRGGVVFDRKKILVGIVVIMIGVAIVARYGQSQ